MYDEGTAKRLVTAEAMFLQELIDETIDMVLVDGMYTREVISTLQELIMKRNVFLS